MWLVLSSGLSVFFRQEVEAEQDTDRRDSGWDSRRVFVPLFERPERAYSPVADKDDQNGGLVGRQWGFQNQFALRRPKVVSVKANALGS